MSIYQSNSYRKDLSWLHFNDEPRVEDAASEGPTHTIWYDVIILDEKVFLRFLRKKVRLLLDFKIRFFKDKMRNLIGV